MKSGGAVGLGGIGSGTSPQQLMDGRLVASFGCIGKSGELRCAA